MKPSVTNLQTHEAGTKINDFASAIGISPDMVIVTKGAKLRLRDEEELQEERLRRLRETSRYGVGIER